MICWIICFLLSAVLLVSSIVLVFLKRAGKLRILLALGLCAVASYAAYLPILCHEHSLPAALLGGITRTFQVVTLDANLLDFYPAAVSAAPSILAANIYLILLGFIHLALPALSATSAVTLVIRWITELRIKLIRGKNDTDELHIFSHITYESLLLAEDIRAHDSKCDILFLDTTEDADHTDLKQRLRCSVISEHITGLKANAEKRKINHYCIGADQEQNLNDALAIISQLQACDRATQNNNHIFIFTTDDIVENMVDSIPKGNVNITIVDPRREAVYHLLQEHPLPRYAKNKEQNLLVCGFSPVAADFVRTALWCGQLADHKLSISVLAKDSDEEFAAFRANFPALTYPRYNIRFYTYHTETEFQRLAKILLPRINYTVVAEPQCEDTIRKSIWLRRQFYRTDSAFRSAPPIFAYIENKDRAEAVRALKTSEAKAERRVSYNITPFGVVSQIYSYKSITDSDIDNLSKNVHLVYEDIFSNGTPMDVPAALERYNLFEVNKRSNIANAMHIRYKLLLLGLDFTDDPNAEEVSLEDYLTPEMLKKLTITEHDRWMAFLESEGWETASLGEVAAYQASDLSKGRHNCPLLKLHPYICPFDILPERSAALNLPDSTVYDRELIARIPHILHDHWNATGKHYKLIRTK